MRRSLVFAAAIVLMVAGLVAANLSREPSLVAVDWRLVQMPAREVLVEVPAKGEVVQTITAPGTIEAVEEAEIASQLVGRVVAVNVEDGDTVKKGDILVQLDDTEARARLDSAVARRARTESMIAQAVSELEKAARDEGLASRLAGRGFTTPTELADARTVVATSKAALEMSRKELIESEAMIRTSQQELDRTFIRAPIDGVISGLEVELGEVVIAGTTNLPGSVLMTLSNLEKMRVRADVDETDVPLVRVGQPVRVFLQADLKRSIPGAVDRVAAKGTVKGEATSFETLIRLEPDAAESDLRPRPGMTATVEVEVKRSREATGVPVQAVVHRRRKDLPDTPEVRAWAERNARSPGEKAVEAEARYVTIVFVVEGGVARARPVDTGISDERRIEIVAGLEPDDPVIVGPFRALDELRDGQAVTPVKTLSVAAEGR